MDRFQGVRSIDEARGADLTALSPDGGGLKVTVLFPPIEESVTGDLHDLGTSGRRFSRRP